MLKRTIDLPPHIDGDMFTLYRPLREGEFVILFVDTAGEGSDYNAAQGLAKEALDVPLVGHYKGSIVDFTPKLKVLLEWICEVTGICPCVAYETNNGGGYELERLSRLNTKQMYTIYCQYKLNEHGELVRTDKKGWNTNSATRPAMLTGIEEVVNNHLITVYDRATITEMFSFVKHRTPSGWKAEAEVGTHDDLLIALSGVWQLYQTELPLKFGQFMKQLPTNDVPSYGQNFGIGQPRGIIQADSTNPFARPVNPYQSFPEEQIFDNRGRLQ
jgi:hypothetical protein